MVSAAEQLAANLNFSALAKADELKKRIWFALGLGLSDAMHGFMDVITHWLHLRHGHRHYYHDHHHEHRAARG